MWSQRLPDLADWPRAWLVQSLPWSSEFWLIAILTHQLFWSRIDASLRYRFSLSFDSPTDQIDSRIDESA